MIRTYAKRPMTTPNEPNAFAFWFSVGPIQSGEVAIVPPTTNVARSAPGKRERNEILRWSRKRGVQSQKIIEPAIQAGSNASKPLARSSDAETVISAISPLKAKNQIVKRSWSAAVPTWMRQARAYTS